MDQAPAGVRAEDPTPISEAALSTKPMAPFFNTPGLRPPHLLLDDGSDGGPLHRAPQFLARAPEDPLPSASETTTPVLLPRPEEARPPSYGSPGYGSQTGNVSAGGATDQTPAGVRTEDPALLCYV